MIPNGYKGPHIINDVTHPMTVILLIIVLTIGGWLTLHTWLLPPAEPKDSKDSSKP